MNIIDTNGRFARRRAHAKACSEIRHALEEYKRAMRTIRRVQREMTRPWRPDPLAAGGAPAVAPEKQVVASARMTNLILLTDFSTGASRK